MNQDFIKTLPQYLMPKKRLTVLAGVLANVKQPAIKNRFIQQFITHYGVNMEEALLSRPEDYACFNDFFIRHLKPECRAISQAAVVSPVDGCVSEIGVLDKDRILQAKGRYYSAAELLSLSTSINQSFDGGHFATLYLSPKDYHRIHMPLTGQLKETLYIPGKLFSVQPTTARVIPHLFARNERLVTLFETSFGPMAMVLVGATIVGAIGTSWQGEIKRTISPVHTVFNEDAPLIAKGEEMGYFKLGSTVVLLFTKDAPIQWRYKAGDALHFGESLIVVP